MKANESKAEQAGGVILFIVSLLLLFVIIPIQIKDITTQGVPPRFMPQVLSGILLVLSVFLFYSGYKKKNTKGQKEYSITKQELKLVLITLGVVGIDIILYKFIGFIFTSIVTLAFLQYIFGQHKIWKIILVSIFLPVLISLFFNKALMINLPLFNLF